MQKELELPNHVLKTDCPTRWGALYAAVGRFLEQEPAIRKVLAADYTSSHLLLSGSDIEVLCNVKHALEPVSTLTNMLAGNLPRLNQYSPSESINWLTLVFALSFRREICYSVLCTSDSDADCIFDANFRGRQFLYDSTSQAQESRKLMRKAAYLDPRFKSGFLDMETSIIYELKQRMVQFCVICMQPIVIIHIL